MGAGKEHNQHIEKNDDKYDFFYLPKGTIFGSLITNLKKDLETIQILRDDVVPYLDRNNTQIQPTPFTIMQIMFNILNIYCMNPMTLIGNKKQCILDPSLKNTSIIS